MYITHARKQPKTLIDTDSLPANHYTFDINDRKKWQVSAEHDYDAERNTHKTKFKPFYSFVTNSLYAKEGWTNWEVNLCKNDIPGKPNSIDINQNFIDTYLSIS